eukprot:577819-Pyramimonas_sp.AAC.1
MSPQFATTRCLRRDHKRAKKGSRPIGLTPPVTSGRKTTRVSQTSASSGFLPQERRRRVRVETRTGGSRSTHLGWRQ